MAAVAQLEQPLNAVVTGASSGVGLAVTTQLLEDAATGRVLAVSRGAEQSDALASLAERHGDRLLRLSADLTDEAAIEAVAKRFHDAIGELHLLFNAAGVLHAPGLRPEKALGQLKLASLQQVFALNAFAPILLAKALLPCLRHEQPAVLASLSARVGSIGDNGLGGWYAYRASKTAQNQLWKTLSVEMRRVNRRAACVVLHPGTVDTPLSSPFKANVPEEKLFSPDRAARQLLGVVAGLGPDDSGRFIAWDGTDIPW